MNLLSLLADLTKHDPHAIVAIDVDPRHRQPVHVSRAELWRQTLQLRADLATAGVGRADGVVVCLPNWSDVLAWHVATASLGAHAIGLHPAVGVDELTHVFERASPKVVALAHDASWAGVLALLRDAVSRAGAALPTVAVVAGPHNEPPIDPSPYDIGGGAWLPSKTTAGMPIPVTSGDELAVAFAPSLAAHRESAVVRHAHATAKAVGLRDDDILMCYRPLTDVYGLCAALAAVAGGATCLLDPMSDAGTLLTDLARFAATHLIADDEVLLRFAQDWPGARRDLPSWRWLGVVDVAGDSQEPTNWAEKEIGIDTTGSYGSAEVLAPAALWPSAAAPTQRWSAGGQPVSAAIDVRVVDPATQRSCPVGEPGELQFRGYNVVDSYLGDPSAVPNRLTADGWWPTGDIAVRTGEGGFHYVGPAGRTDHPHHPGRATP